MHRLVLLLGVLMAFCMVSCGGDGIYDDLNAIPIVDEPGNVSQEYPDTDNGVTWFCENTNDRNTGITI